MEVIKDEKSGARKERKAEHVQRRGYGGGSKRLLGKEKKGLIEGRKEIDEEMWWI